MGVSHPLYARVLLFEEGERSNKRRALLVSADLIWWGEEQVERLRDCLKARWGCCRGGLRLSRDRDDRTG